MRYTMYRIRSDEENAKYRQKSCGHMDNGAITFMS